MAQHRLDASADTVHWGYFDAALKPLITIDSGDTVTISTVSGQPTQLPEARLGPHRAAGAAGDPPERAAEARRPAHPDRAGGGARRQGRAGARGPHQGDRAALRLGLQHDPAARPARCPTTSRKCALIHIPLDKQRMVGTHVVGPRNCRSSRSSASWRWRRRRPGARSTRRRRAGTAATWTTRNWSPAPRSICRSMPTARCSPAATATARRATARSASPRSRPG